MKVNFKFITVALTLLLSGCAGPALLARANTCPVPTRPGVPEYLCQHCNCIMQVADGEWEQTCNVCHCKKTFKACRR